MAEGAYKEADSDSEDESNFGAAFVEAIDVT